MSTAPGELRTLALVKPLGHLHRTQSPMSTATAPSGESSRPSWVLLHVHARVGENRNNTTAMGKTRNKEKIFASLFAERPPLPSNLYVDCPDGTLRDPPTVHSMVDDLILFHAYIGSEYRFPSMLKCDYFIYRADPKRPFLKLLPHPDNRFRRLHQVGILPRGDDHYTIAALVPFRARSNHFLLHLLDSETEIWTSKMLCVESPQMDFPVEMPEDISIRISRHTTSAVITLGGTMGWVDLWRGIVFCDMLREKHTLRGVPLPLPMKYITAIDESNQALGRARYFRGIAFINGCLRFVELESDFIQLPGHDEVTGWANCRVESWTITTWSNRKMSDSYEDWHKDCTLQASDIAIGDHSESELLLTPPDSSGDQAEAEQRGLQNLFVSDPTFGMNDSDGDGDVVYLTARLKFRHPKSWVLAIDMRNHRVQSVVNSGPHMQHIDATYCTCSISQVYQLILQQYQVDLMMLRNQMAW